MNLIIRVLSSAEAQCLATKGMMNMSRRQATPTLSRIVFLLLSLCMYVGTATAAVANTLTATLNGGREIGTIGDPDGFGSASVTFNPDRTQVTFQVTASLLANVTGGHIHRGTATVSGPILVPFVSEANPFVNGKAVTVPVDRALADEILGNPAGFYVNLHTPEFPAGAIRGQLSAANARSLGPIVRITSPSADSFVAPGEGSPGAGSPNGTGFAINVEFVTRDPINLSVREAANIRDTTLLGQPNPLFPGFFVFFDCDLPKPDGGVIPKNTNLASLFNIAGTDDTPGEGITVWAGWHVLESIPAGVDSFSMTAGVRDSAGRVAFDRVTLRVQRGATLLSGQTLTPAPLASLPGDGVDDADGPELVMIAPRVPTRIARGPAGTPVAPAGSLFFIQLGIRDRSRGGIGITEGLIADRTQVPNPTVNPAGGPNRNFPGLLFTFDVPLRQPNGNLIPAGANLAPLFDIAGSEIDKEGYVVVTADWVVGGSVEIPAGKDFITLTARVTNNLGRTSTVRQVVGVSDVVSGQDLTSTP